MPDAPVIDTRAIERLRKWGGEKLPLRIAGIFLQHSPERLDQIREGIREGNPRLAETGAHSLKSSAGNVGASQLQAICQVAETLAEAGDLRGVEELLSELENAHAAAVEELRSILEGSGE